jgi:hypothetical protein
MIRRRFLSYSLHYCLLFPCALHLCIPRVSCCLFALDRLPRCFMLSGFWQYSVEFGVTFCLYSVLTLLFIDLQS